MRAATRTQISGWFDQGVAKMATHMIVVCDTYGHDDYPVYVSPGDNSREEVDKANVASMQRVMECYDLSLDRESQLNEFRAFHY